ncbi:MAG: shikimate dehydrogenase [Chloroflexota bacterium]|nr:shikimate dehydrogenase [Chloroflexota bacterium]
MIKPVKKRTFYFIGVTTAQSSIMKIFPRWMKILGQECAIVGYDAPLNAPPAVYREIVEHIKRDPRVVGGLVTAHKISLLDAAFDLFDELDDLATLAGEVSGIGKQGEKLIGFARDPISSRLAMDAFVPTGHFERNNPDVLCFGSGGAAVAIMIALAKLPTPPRKIILVDINPDRLAHAREIYNGLETEIHLAQFAHKHTIDNDQLISNSRDGSLVINATGMGKDLPGSPISDAARFPDNGLAWELNYRGELTFLKQARAQAERLAAVEDGWTYFVHGWTQVVAGVFGVKLTPDLFQQMDEAART